MGSAGDLAAPWTLVPSGELPVGPPVAGRFDDDAVPDVVYTVDRRIVVRFGLGDGSFAPPIDTGLEPDDYGIAAIDVDGDGRDELVGGSDIISFSSDGLPLVHATFDKGNHHYPFRLAEAADLNGDGLLDILLMTEGGQEPPAIHLVLSNP